MPTWERTLDADTPACRRQSGGFMAEMAPGEIARSLARLEKAIARIDSRIENLDVVSRGEYLAHRQGDELRLTAIEEDVRELQDEERANRRMVLGSLAFPLVVALVTGILLAAMS